MPSFDHSTLQMDLQPKTQNDVEVRLGIRIQYLEQKVRQLEERLDKLSVLVDVMKQF